MCLIIHKPAGARIPDELLAAAAVHNPDGWGLMGFAANGRLLVQNHAHVDLDELLDAERAFEDAEIALHLRRRTRGGTDIDNVHPFKILPGYYFMHNGTLRIEAREVSRSDSWHFVSDVLRPLAQRHPRLLSDHAFLRVLEQGLKPHHKAALLDQRNRRIVVINREYGAEIDGLWLSSTRWIDGRLFPIATPPQPQVLAHRPQELHFL